MNWLHNNQSLVSKDHPILKHDHLWFETSIDWLKAIGFVWTGHLKATECCEPKYGLVIGYVISGSSHCANILLVLLNSLLIQYVLGLYFFVLFRSFFFVDDMVFLFTLEDNSELDIPSFLILTMTGECKSVTLWVCIRKQYQFTPDSQYSANAGLPQEAACCQCYKSGEFTSQCLRNHNSPLQPTPANWTCPGEYFGLHQFLLSST